MKHDMLIFDLDGTISDPKNGIIRSINYALECHSFEIRKEVELVKYIGPPLDVAFIALTQSKDPGLIVNLVDKYRERYADIGYAENVLYAGIHEALTALYQYGDNHLAICTSKRVDFATKILDMFGLLDMFEFMNGGDVGIQKHQQLAGLLEEELISKHSLMIGDRDVDLTAAHQNGINSAGVLWGYGSEDEITKENPMYVLSAIPQLSDLNDK